MSSLAATQADGYYLPPDYFDSGAYKKKSKNEFAGSKGHNQFVAKGVCRFELPYNGICLNPKCGQIIRRGTRFNAKKTECEEKYYTSKIYEFQMNCRRCGESEFIIRTNPKGRCFDYISGIKKKMEEFDTAEAGTLGVIDTDIGNGIFSSSDAGVSIDENDDIAHMEKQNEDIRRVNGKMDAIRQSFEFQRTHMMDDHASNAKLRASFRVDRKAKKQRLAKAASMGLGRGIEVSEEQKADLIYASRAFEDSFEIQHRKVVQRETNAFGQVRKQSIFSTKNPSKRNQKYQREIIKKEEVDEIHSNLSTYSNEADSSSIPSKNPRKHIALSHLVNKSNNGNFNSISALDMLDYDSDSTD